MRPTLAFLVTSLALSAAPKVGTFAAESKRVYTTASGLPSDDVRCVAVSGSTVWAGTAAGLAARTNNTWATSDSRPVTACVAANNKIYAAVPGAIVSGSTTVHKLPPAAGEVHALALASTGQLLIAAEGGLYNDKGARLITAPIYVVAVSPKGEIAAGGANGLYIFSQPQYPRDGQKSWAPTNVRGVAYTASGQLTFSSAQGFGIRDASGNWKLYTGTEGLPYDEATALAIAPDGSYWLGTTRGAIHYDGKNWAYRQGLRWLPDDAVRSIAVDATGTAWFATSKGLGSIERKPITLPAKARIYEDDIDKHHRRTPYEYVHTITLKTPGDLSNYGQSDSDNDGLWTAMYGAGENFGYAATKDPKTRQRAIKAFKALAFLSEVTQGGEHPAPAGFPARSILPTSGPDPNIRDSRERDIRTQANRDHLWKIMSPRWPRNPDGKWFWKTDTSSDELDGHYFLYATYYDLVAETAEEKEEVRNVVRRITDHLMTHNWALVDWDGKPTRWAVYDPKSLNEDRLWWNGRGLNSLSILSYLKVAHHMTGDAKYQAAYESLIKDHHYDTNIIVPKIQTGPGTGNQSDDEMAFMCYYNLLKYETDDNLRQKYAVSLANYWAIERVERNPFFNFVAAAALKGQKFTDAFRTLDLTPQGDWLEDSIDTLRRFPLDRVDWGHRNSFRKDIVPLRGYIAEDDDRPRGGVLRNGKVLPVDERFFHYWNHNPFALDSGGRGLTEGDGAVYLLPYYMGLYHGFFED